MLLGEIRVRLKLVLLVGFHRRIHPFWTDKPMNDEVYSFTLSFKLKVIYY
jgi:hypothetical protein